jgi:hypothetical protein
MMQPVYNQSKDEERKKLTKQKSRQNEEKATERTGGKLEE